MSSLAEAQTNFIATINDGPDSLDPSMFAGPRDRILLGLKAHANTISHARIVALEETFPLTREHLGDAAFNALARDFVETDVARASDINRIGLGFPDVLADAVTIELAQIELAWLESYNAAESKSLTLADLGGLNEAALLELPVAPHPSARVLKVSSPLAAVLHDLASRNRQLCSVSAPMRKCGWFQLIWFNGWSLQHPPEKTRRWVTFWWSPSNRQVNGLLWSQSFTSSAQARWSKPDKR